MTPARRVAHKFLEFIPTELAEATIYISIPYATVVHLCLCGCGQRVVTPLSPTDWRLTFDGESVSLDPSVGNWNFACQSHYWVERGSVHWARRWSQEKIDANRASARRAKERYFEESDNVPAAFDQGTTEEAAQRSGWLRTLLQHLR